MEVQGLKDRAGKGNAVGEACVLAPVIHVSQGIQPVGGCRGRRRCQVPLGLRGTKNDSQCQRESF